MEQFYIQQISFWSKNRRVIECDESLAEFGWIWNSFHEFKKRNASLHIDETRISNDMALSSGYFAWDWSLFNKKICGFSQMANDFINISIAFQCLSLSISNIYEYIIYHNIWFYYYYYLLIYIWLCLTYRARKHKTNCKKKLNFKVWKKLNWSRIFIWSYWRHSLTIHVPMTQTVKKSSAKMFPCHRREWNWTKFIKWNKKLTIAAETSKKKKWFLSHRMERSEERMKKMRLKKTNLHTAVTVTANRPTAGRSYGNSSSYGGGRLVERFSFDASRNIIECVRIHTVRNSLNDSRVNLREDCDVYFVVVVVDDSEFRIHLMWKKERNAFSHFIHAIRLSDDRPAGRFCTHSSWFILPLSHFYSCLMHAHKAKFVLLLLSFRNLFLFINAGLIRSIEDRFVNHWILAPKQN